ncbi:MAG TPA: ABC transporter ATP-binding protein [Thermodesulfobacteriota bacterium]|nr:ABC transporter ATP-binding protein [Thermodesulfobacteriota bacterium]
MFLTVRNLSIHFRRVEAVKNVSMEVPEGVIVALLGANGAGKSTLFKGISGFLKPISGSIWFREERIDSTLPDEILRKGISQVLEGKRLFRRQTVLENLDMGAYSRNDDRREITKDRDELLERFPILKEKAKVKSGLLSGGQQQILAIARSLMAKPKLLLMDEPAQGLAPLVIHEISEIIRKLNGSGLTIMVIEHNVRLALGLADKVFILDNGKLIFEGTPASFSEDEYAQKVYLGG